MDQSDLGDNLDTEFESTIPIEVGHHLEQVHCIAEVKSVLHMQNTDEWFLVVEVLCLVEEYGLR